MSVGRRWLERWLLRNDLKGKGGLEGFREDRIEARGRGLKRERGREMSIIKAGRGMSYWDSQERHGPFIRARLDGLARH